MIFLWLNIAWIKLTGIQKNQTATTVKQLRPYSRRSVKIYFLLVLYAFLAPHWVAASPAVKSIKVMNAIGQNLQVAEVQAFQTGTGTNVALASNGAIATASSIWQGVYAPASKAIDGVGVSGSGYPNIYHSGSASNSEYLLVTLANATELSSITISGRTDCCSNRDIYKVYLYDSNNNLLRSYTSQDASGSNHKVTINLPNLLAAYHFEETIWNGTAGELKDYSGNNLNASALSTSSPKPSYAYTSPAVAGSTGTCGYANMPGPFTGGGAFNIASLPVSTAANAQTSVAFWMYWDGNSWVMPIGWSKYDLYFNETRFGFNTSNSDIYGISSSSLANGWHHVAAIFTNGNVASNVLYIDGVQKTLSQTGTNLPAFAVVQSTLQAGGWTSSNESTNYRFSGRIDELKVYNGALSAAEVSQVYAETHPCSITPTAPLAEYRMDELAWGGTSNEITDSSGNGYNGAAKNGTSTATAKICMGGLFNGSSNYTEVPDNTALQLTNNYTLSAWVKTTTSAAMISIFAKYRTANPWYGYDFALSNGKLAFNSGSINNNWYYGTTAVNDNTWHHIAARVSGTSLQFYIDGLPSGSPITIVASTTTSTTPLRFGLNSDPVCCGYRYFNGQMDELKMWNTALSDTQIYTLYTNENAGNNWDGSTRICPALLGEYRMEDTTWNGTAGEVADSSGNNRNGTATGSTGLPIMQGASAAKVGSPGTCTFGSFAGATNNQAINLGAIDLGIGNTSAFSMSAWVRWTVTPSSGNAYATIIANNSASAVNTQQFGLAHNTNNSQFEFDLTTTTGRSYIFSTTAPAINTWYHLTGVYDGTKMYLYVNGALNNSASKTGTITPFSSNYLLTFGRWAYNSSNYRAFKGNIDEVKFYNYALSATDVTNIYNASHACPVSFTGASASNFNCVESAADPASGHLYTKLASTPFSFDVVTLKPDGTSIETNYVGLSANKNVTVELVDNTTGTDCPSRTALSPAISQTLTFTTTDQGRKTIANMTPSKAYSNLRCRVTDANVSPSVVACSTDNFSVRPSGFTVSSSMNADNTGTSASATPILKTGSNFTLTAASGAANYNSTPQIDLSKLAAHTGAVQSGTLIGSFSAANSATGSASGSAFSYSEVGYFKLDPYGIYDDSFTAVDSGNGDCTADFSNTLVNGKYGCKFGNTAASSFFGRFIPDHLTATASANGSFNHACTGANFSYNGQAISYNSHPALLVTAYNSANAITQNYTGNFARLNSSQFTFTNPSTDALKLGVDGTNKLQLSRTAGTASLTDNINGSLTYTFGNDSFTYSRENNALVAPFTNAINLTFTSIVDSDSVAANNLPISLQPAGEEIRYGRVALSNAVGSELTDLPVPMTVEHYDGHNFVTNTNDQCSVATLSISDPAASDSLAPADTCIWDDSALSGANKCTGTAPVGSSFKEASTLTSGSFNLNLKAPAKTGALTVTGAVASWLQFNWQGAGMANPSAQASFGLYKGSPEVIYFREVY